MHKDLNCLLYYNFPIKNKMARHNDVNMFFAKQNSLGLTYFYLKYILGLILTSINLLIIKFTKLIQ